ncbi:MAG TPA: AAA family ATPase [Casimicrobium sp.]|nr:AAA family ATPase [Casimicrobium sp.]
MKLQRAEIRNFRSIREVNIDFDPRCRVLVGINESGKSNVLKALALLDPARAPLARDARMESNDEAPPEDTFVRFVCTLAKDEQFELFEAMSEKFAEKDRLRPLVQIDPQTRLTLQEFCSSRTERLYTVEVSDGSRMHSTWASPRAWKLVPGWCRTKSAITLTRNTSREAFSAAPGTWFFSSEYEQPPATEVETPDLAMLTSTFSGAGKPIAERGLPKCIFWEYREQDLLPSSVSVDEFSANPLSCVPLANMFALADIEYSEIANSIANARSRGPVFYQRLLEKVGSRTTSYLRKVWKDHAKVSIELLPNGALVTPIVRDLEIPLDFGSRSDGFKRMTNFLLHVSAAVSNEAIEDTLILIDEPEVGLHPTGARDLAEELFGLSSKNTIVFATHSIFMIDRVRIDRHVVVKKHKETTTIENAGKADVVDEEVLYQALGWSFREVLPLNNVVFEGWRDKQLYSAWIGTSTKTSTSAKPTSLALGLTHAVGVKDVSNVCRQLELAQRKCLVMSDGDRMALEWKKRHETDRVYGTWHTYLDVFDDGTRITGEDFLGEHALIARCRNFVEERGLVTPPYGELTIVPRWPKIVSWIAVCAAGDKDRSKVLEHELKSRLFEGLTKAEIDPVYGKVHKFIEEHFTSDEA